jgi:hypothetical protein
VTRIRVSRCINANTWKEIVSPYYHTSIVARGVASRFFRTFLAGDGFGLHDLRPIEGAHIHVALSGHAVPAMQRSRAAAQDEASDKAAETSGYSVCLTWARYRSYDPMRVSPTGGD